MPILKIPLSLLLQLVWFDCIERRIIVLCEEVLKNTPGDDHDVEWRSVYGCMRCSVCNTTCSVDSTVLVE